MDYEEIKKLIDDMLEQEIEFTPVDLCAKSIVALSKKSICNNKVFNSDGNHIIDVQTIGEDAKGYSQAYCFVHQLGNVYGEQELRSSWYAGQPL